MMEGSKRTPVVISTGVALLFVTFIILCLVVFALLSFSTAKADSKTCEKRATSATQYYAACNRANEKVAKIDEKLESLVKTEKENGDGVIFPEEIREAFADETDISILLPKDGGCPELSFSEAISEDRHLDVTLLLTDASFGTLEKQTAEHYYSIKGWQTIVEAQ